MDGDEGEYEANYDAVRSDMSTRSVTTSVFNFHRENGRTYHGYRAGCECFNFLWYCLCFPVLACSFDL